MDTNDPLVAHIPAPTAARPLLGLTVLVVEDSRFACEAIRLLCLRSGARIRRADCLRSARRHLRVYRPAVAMIDLGLPDGSGLDLIAELSATQPRVEVIMGMSADDHLGPDALTAGADGFIAKPIRSLAVFQSKVLALLPEGRRPKGPRVMNETVIRPDRIAYRDDIAHIADVLDDSEDAYTLDYVAQFLTGVARSADDPTLEKAAVDLANRRALGQPAASETAVLAGMIQDRLAEKIAI
jgi:DNA-binding response OmpR family regulator